MMKYIAILLSLGIIIGISASRFETQTDTHSNNQKSKDMNSLISIFEIPATDITRAVKFYQTILDIQIELIDMQGTQMGILPSEGQSVSGVISQGEGYEPSAQGVLVYFNGGDNLEPMLNKIAENGGEIVLPKTLIDEENGYFALFLDTEGNKIGLHSPQ